MEAAKGLGRCSSATNPLPLGGRDEDTEMKSPQVPSSPSTPNVLSEDIIDLLAEALFQDFQQHRRVTVNSPRGIDHKKQLTNKANENK